MKRPATRVALSVLAACVLGACSQKAEPPPKRLEAMRAIRAEVILAPPTCTPVGSGDFATEQWTIAHCAFGERDWLEAMSEKIAAEIARHNDERLTQGLAKAKEQHANALAACPGVIRRTESLRAATMAECERVAFHRLMSQSETVLWSQTPSTTAQQ